VTCEQQTHVAPQKRNLLQGENELAEQAETTHTVDSEDRTAREAVSSAFGHNILMQLINFAARLAYHHICENSWKINGSPLRTPLSKMAISSCNTK